MKTTGFSDASCRFATRFIEQALGQRQGEQMTAEFYQSADQQAETRQQA